MDQSLAERLPRLPEGVRREIYVRAAGEEVMALLTEKGYTPVDLMTLPNSTEQDRRDYLRKLAQALTDGTVHLESEGRRRVELEMKSLGLLDSKVVHETRTKEEKMPLEDLLNWEPSRNTMAGNSTIVSANELAARAKEKLQ